MRKMPLMQKSSSFEDAKEEAKNQLNISLPKIVDFSSDHPLAQFENPYEEADEYSEIQISKLKAVITEMIPKSGYTINIMNSDIVLTVNIKNTGDLAWPKGFKIWSDKTEEKGRPAFESILNFVRIDPGETIQLDVTIKNPGTKGSYSYIFYLIDSAGRRFGDAFYFDFTVKDHRVNIMPEPYLRNPYQNNRYDNRRPLDYGRRSYIEKEDYFRQRPQRAHPYSGGMRQGNPNPRDLRNSQGAQGYPQSYRGQTYWDEDYDMLEE